MNIEKKHIILAVSTVIIVAFFNSFLANLLLYLITGDYIHPARMLLYTVIGQTLISNATQKIGGIIELQRCFNIFNEKPKMVNIEEKCTAQKIEKIFEGYKNEIHDKWALTSPYKPTEISEICKDAPIPDECPDFLDFLGHLTNAKIPWEYPLMDQSTGEFVDIGVLHLNRGRNAAETKEIHIKIILHSYDAEKKVWV